MATGRSIHIGLNSVDPKHYKGWSGPLGAPEADATAMEALAQAAGFETERLLTKDATSDGVVAAIEKAGEVLSGNDILLLTYSGHGSQVPDQNRDEEEGKDETWCLYDRNLVDDELYELWSHFGSGTRILVLSDSCHSGSVVKAFPDSLFSSLEIGECKVENLQPKAPHEDIAVEVYEEHKGDYDAIQDKTPAYDDVKIDASVLLISGCQDNQESFDGDPNGAFTTALLQTWDNASFKGDYLQFWRKIQEKLPPVQSPNYFTAGTPDPAFEAQRPFTI